MATSQYEQVPSDYTDVGIAISGVIAYGFASVTWNLLTKREFNPKKQSNTATAVGVVAGLATVSSRLLTVKTRGSPGVYGIGNPPNWY